MATFIKCLSRAWPWAKSLMCKISFSFHSDSVRRVVFSYSYKWRMWGPERLGHLPKSTQRRRGRARIRRRSLGLESQCSVENYIISTINKVFTIVFFLRDPLFSRVCWYFFNQGAAAIYKAWTQTSKTTVQERWTKEQECVRSLCGGRLQPAIW